MSDWGVLAQRSKCLHALGKHQLCIADCDKALVLCTHDVCSKDKAALLARKGTILFANFLLYACVYKWVYTARYLQQRQERAEVLAGNLQGKRSKFGAVDDLHDYAGVTHSVSDTCVRL
jgi:hypothetical protein